LKTQNAKGRDQNKKKKPREECPRPALGIKGGEERKFIKEKKPTNSEWPDRKKQGPAKQLGKNLLLGGNKRKYRHGNVFCRGGETRKLKGKNPERESTKDLSNVAGGVYRG